jgi:hypothetical protein
MLLQKTKTQVPWETQEDSTNMVPRTVGSTNTPCMESYQVVSDRILEHFSNLNNILTQLVEFLTQSCSDVLLTQSMHRGLLLSSIHMTALHLIYFSNLLYSKALLVNMAARTFVSVERHNNLSRQTDAVNIFGVPIPVMVDNKSYQF